MIFICVLFCVSFLANNITSKIPINKKHVKIIEYFWCIQDLFQSGPHESMKPALLGIFIF